MIPAVLNAAPARTSEEAGTVTSEISEQGISDYRVPLNEDDRAADHTNPDPAIVVLGLIGGLLPRRRNESRPRNEDDFEIQGKTGDLEAAVRKEALN